MKEPLPLWKSLLFAGLCICLVVLVFELSAGYYLYQKQSGFAAAGMQLLMELKAAMAKHFRTPDTSPEASDDSALERLYSLGLPRKFTPRLGGYAGRTTPWPLLMSASPAYAGKPWADEFWEDEHRWYACMATAASCNTFQPNVIWRNAPRSGKYVNIDRSGIRQTRNHRPSHFTQRVKVFLFGGSTMLGSGVPDDYTIASYLSQYLNERQDGRYYEVTNFGTHSYIIEQDKELLLDEIKRGNVPQFVVFYNGANDVFAGVFSPGKPGWYLGSQSVERKLLGVDQTTVSTVYPDYFLSDFTPRAKAFLNFYFEELKVISSLGDTRGFKSLFIWQPLLLYGNKPRDDFEGVLAKSAFIDIGSFVEKNGEYIRRAVETTYRLIERHPPQGVQVDNLSHIFDQVGRPLFTDYVHVADDGNAIVARAIAEKIK